MLPTIQKILFATDLSEQAEYAFGYAALCVLTVIQRSVLAVMTFRN